MHYDWSMTEPAPETLVPDSEIEREIHLPYDQWEKLILGTDNDNS